MKTLKLSNYKIIVFFISVFSFLVSVWQSTYIYDAHHWGLMASNASEFLNNKIPYEEIFIQYGLLTTIIHSLFFKLGNESVISIFFFTSIIYSISIYYFYLIIRNKFQDQLALFAVICLFLIHPFVNHPWHNYLTFFFLILSLFFLENNENKYTFFSGLFLSFAVLTYEKFIIIFLFFLIGFVLINFYNNKKKIFYLLSGFIFPISIFFCYLIIFQLLDDWLKYTNISNLYIGDNLILTILSFLKSFLQISITKFIFEPYWMFFLIILILNTIFICFFILKKNFLKKNEEYLFYISMITISSFSAAIHSLNSFRLATGSIVGIFILIYFLNKIKNLETKKISCFCIIIILFLGVNFKKSENNKLFVTPVYFEHYTNSEIKYFKNMKFKKDTWNHINFFNKKMIEIRQKCPDINYAINYTNDNYYYLLISNIFQTFQIKPSINKKNTLDTGTLELINPNLYYDLQEKIINNETVIVADLVFVVPQNYNFINLPYSYNNKYKRILIPKRCKIKV